jgi:hypothetical protein
MARAAGPVSRTVLLAIVFALWAAAARGEDVTVPGIVTVVKPQSLAKFVSKSGLSPFALPAPGSGHDPTLAGAVLRIFDTDDPGAGDVSFPLDASGWEGLGNPAGSAGYKYRGKDDAVDPDPQGTCKVVLLKKKVIKGVCKSPAVALAPPFAASEGVRLGITAGTVSLRYCATFGGAEKRNDTTLMKRKGAPAPLECAGAPQDRRPCGDTELACHGVCAAGQVCAQNPVGPGACICIPETAVPCQDTGGAPAPGLCGGACPDGLSCATIFFDIDEFEVECACIPSDAVGCGESSAPSCAGTCPSGLSCQAGGFGSFSCVCA